MADSNQLDIVSAYQDAWTAGSYEAAAEYLAAGAVFHSPGQHLAGVEAITTMLRAFGSRIGRGWELIAWSVDGEQILIIYNLFMPDGSPALCADYFTVRQGKIQYELLTFDAKPFAAAQPPPPPQD
ncbi:MAG TPA: nuclear transport factor 2 family protein [Chloroflexota bacterium]|nr:nuclear transport factor 2 family protein [Chloroflexota bacterium]